MLSVTLFFRPIAARDYDKSGCTVYSLSRSFDEFAFHLHTNTIGPIICAQRLLKSNIPIGTIVFMSSDSGSAQRFREIEDGFAAYAASKAALNQMLRHMAAELKRKDDDTIILALHPGEVATYVYRCSPMV